MLRSIIDESDQQYRSDLKINTFDWVSWNRSFPALMVGLFNTTAIRIPMKSNNKKYSHKPYNNYSQKLLSVRSFVEYKALELITKWSEAKGKNGRNNHAEIIRALYSMSDDEIYTSTYRQDELERKICPRWWHFSLWWVQRWHSTSYPPWVSK